MENNENLPEFDLEDILKEFHDPATESTGEAEQTMPEEASTNSQEPAAEISSSDSELATLLKDISQFEGDADPVPESVPQPPAESAEKTAAAPTDTPTAEEAKEKGDSGISEDVLSQITKELPTEELTTEASAETEGVEVPDSETIRIEELTETEAADTETEADAEAETPETQIPPPIPFSSRNKLHELKRKLIAGPEKRYYDLSELGVGKLQIAIGLNLLVLILSAGATTLFTMGMVPDNRLKLVIFSQILAMLISALLGSQQLMDGISDLFHAKFSISTLLVFTLLACCADSVFCLRELRVPSCACFTLEMTFALLARYHRRSTEMGQMDTLRKAVKLRSLVVEPDFKDGKPGILQGEADVDDFMDTYGSASTPKKVQSVYAFLCLVLSLGIATLAGMRHNPSLALQVLSTSLLISVPASFFVTLTRPAALLERRLHMVGSVLCGWQGVKKLSGKAIFPLRDEDLFPKGSTKLNGVKFYGSREPEQILSYTTSLITFSGGGLVPVFQGMLANRGSREYPVTEYQDYPGGIGGVVCGEPVLMGSLNFLQDMGIEIPQGTMVNQAVYAAIDGELCAVIAITYSKMHFASAGLVSLCGNRRITPIMVGRDFMLTEEFVRSKFNIHSRRLVFPDQEVRTELAAKTADPESIVLAICTRDDLVSAAYAVSGAAALRKACNLGVAIHLIGGILGLLIMLALAYLGTTDLLTPTHVLLYQLVWTIPGLLITEWTRAV